MTSRRQPETTALALLCGLALLIAGYWLTRFGGYIMEGDATRLTQAADGIVRESRLVNVQSYSNGYGYSALLAFLVEMTGLSVQHLQLAGSLWLVVLITAAYLTYRELIGEPAVAALGVFLLLCQCDFLFYILRSSHERTTWTFGLIILWLWARTLRTSDLRVRAALIPLIYLFIWAIISNNAFFGSTLLVTFLIATLSGLALGRLLPSGDYPAVEPRTLYVLASGTILLFVFTTYVYPPAMSYYYTLETIGQRMSVLLLGSEPLSERLAVSDTYGYVQQAWVSRSIYFVLTTFQWLTVLASAAAWLRDALILLRRGQGALSRPRMLLWLFYLGFGTQVALGVLSDLSGTLGSNLQVRLFTPFALVICPMAATWLIYLRRAAFYQRPRLRLALRAVAAGAGSLAVVLGLLKLTNDPLVSNYWLFYTPGEQVALDWVDGHLERRSVWIDTWTHQQDIQLFHRGYNWEPANAYASGFVSSLNTDRITHILLSELTLYQANRSKLPLPAVVDHNQVYDNGDTRLYHRRQQSPFQK